MSPDAPQTDTSEDEHLTEEQALARAKEEGIEFVDEWRLGKTESPGEMLPEPYATKKDAETALGKLDNGKDYQVIQTRRQKS